MISHVNLNKPLQGTPDEQATELYNLRRELEATQRALKLSMNPVDEDTAEELVNLITNKHRITECFQLTKTDIAAIMNHVRIVYAQ